MELQKNIFYEKTSCLNDELRRVLLGTLSFAMAMQYAFKFQSECKYPKMMQVLHLNYITLLKEPSNIIVNNFAIPSFSWINMFGII